LAGSRRILGYSIPDFHVGMMLLNASSGKAFLERDFRNGCAP
jgi:hypothetical protein